MAEGSQKNGGIAAFYLMRKTMHLNPFLMPQKLGVDIDNLIYFPHRDNGVTKLGKNSR